VCQVGQPRIPGRILASQGALTACQVGEHPDSGPDFGLLGPPWVSQGVPGCPRESKGMSNITFNYLMYIFSDIFLSKVKCQKRRTLNTINSTNWSVGAGTRAAKGRFFIERCCCI
jgi:hypothetical protein